MLKNNLIAGAAVLALLVSGLTFLKPIVVNVTPATPAVQVVPTLGAAGTENTSLVSFYDGIREGGKIDLQTTSTLTAANVCDAAQLDIQIANGTVVRFPSSTAVTSRCLGTGTIFKDFMIYNRSTSGSLTLAVADGSSTLLNLSIGSTSATVGTSSLPFQTFAKVRMLRTTSATEPWVFWFLDAYKK